MSRIRLSLACVLAVGALGSMALPATGQAYEYKVEGNAVTGYTAVQDDAPTITEIKGTPFGVQVTITCYRNDLSGGLLGGGASTLTMALSSCEVSKGPTQCEVKEPLLLQLHGSLVGSTSPEDEFTGASGGVFTTFTFGGAGCSIKAEPMQISGRDTCKLIKVTTESENQKMECTTSGSSALRWGGKIASLASFLPEVHLVNEQGKATKQKWSAS